MSAPTRSSAESPHPVDRPRGHFGSAPRVLVTSLIGFALVVATTLIAVAASGVEMLSEATETQYAAALGLIAVRGAVFLLAFCWGGIGIALVARRLLTGGGRARPLAVASLILCAISVAAGVAQLIASVAAVGFSEPRFGDTLAYHSYLASTFLMIEGAVAAVALAALAARTAGIRPTFMLVLALVCAAYVIVDLTTRGGVPPFGVAFLWLSLGIGLRASRIPA